jgi:two-component system chemotaxis response regulator CheB
MKTAEPSLAELPITLVAIGASAGGVEAIGTLLQALPAGFPAAVAVVLHIPPDSASLLAPLFAPRCALKVKEVDDKEPLLPGCVYFAAPDYHMLVEPDRSLSLSQDDAVNFSRPSIDMLMESAAIAYGPQMLGIVLTGGSPDGSEGLLRVREQGGAAWVQDPTDAMVPAMPASAIARAGADRILTIVEMARQLAGLGKNEIIQGNPQP